MKKILFFFYKNKLIKANKIANEIRKKNNIPLFFNITKDNLYYCEIDGLFFKKIIFHFKDNNNVGRRVIKLNRKGELLEIYEEENDVINKVKEIDNINYKVPDDKVFKYLKFNNMSFKYFHSSIDSFGNITDLYYKEIFKTYNHIVTDPTFHNKKTRSWVRLDLVNKELIFGEILKKKNNSIIREKVYYYKKENLSTYYKYLIALN